MTPHNIAKKEEIASTVLLFGDPTQTHHLAHKYLSNVKLVSNIRFSCFFTGEYNGKKYTFGSHGMGLGSSSIYIYELYSFYDVKTIIRVGSCGGLNPDFKATDTILVTEAYSDDKTLSEVYKTQHEDVLLPTPAVFSKLSDCAKKLKIGVRESRTFTTDIFYGGKKSLEELRKESWADVIEMEAYILFYLAKLLKKDCACLLTIVNMCVPGGTWLTQLEQVDARCPSVEIILNSGIA